MDAAIALADVDVESGPVALAVRRREARQARVDAADELTPLLDRVERLAGACALPVKRSQQCALPMPICFIMFLLLE